MLVLSMGLFLMRKILNNASIMLFEYSDHCYYHYCVIILYYMFLAFHNVNLFSSFVPLQALYELVKCDFDTEEALRRLRFNVKAARGK